MSRITHHKLVRDRIPEMIEASGKTCVTRTLDDAAYLAALDQKLTEEEVIEIGQRQGHVLQALILRCIEKM